MTKPNAGVALPPKPLGVVTGPTENPVVGILGSKTLVTVLNHRSWSPRLDAA